MKGFMGEVLHLVLAGIALLIIIMIGAKLYGIFLSDGIHPASQLNYERFTSTVEYFLESEEKYIAKEMPFYIKNGYGLIAIDINADKSSNLFEPGSPIELKYEDLGCKTGGCICLVEEKSKILACSSILENNIYFISPTIFNGKGYSGSTRLKNSLPYGYSGSYTTLTDFDLINILIEKIDLNGNIVIRTTPIKENNNDVKGLTRTEINSMTALLTKCSNDILDSSESDIDCGGSCPIFCSIGRKCQRDYDCITNYCNPSSKLCGCIGDDDCQDGEGCRRSDRICVPHCEDESWSISQGEINIDCGGPCDACKCIIGKFKRDFVYYDDGTPVSFDIREYKWLYSLVKNPQYSDFKEVTELDLPGDENSFINSFAKYLIETYPNPLVSRDDIKGTEDFIKNCTAQGYKITVES